MNKGLVYLRSFSHIVVELQAHSSLVMGNWQNKHYYCLWLVSWEFQLLNVFCMWTQCNITVLK